MRAGLAAYLVFFLTGWAPVASAQGVVPDGGTAPSAETVAEPVAEPAVILDVNQAHLWINVPDGGVEQADVLGGSWSNDTQTILTGKELVALRAENKSLSAEFRAPPSWVIAAFGIGFALGITGGVVLGYSLRK